MNELEQKVAKLERELKALKSLMDVFSGQIVFKKKVKFNANVYDANGAVVTEINNL